MPFVAISYALVTSISRNAIITDVLTALSIYGR